MSESRNITAEQAEQTKAVERLRKLVAKRSEMLEAAYKEQERVNFKVSRREEILAEHETLLAEAEDKLAELNQTVEAASTEA